MPELTGIDSSYSGFFGLARRDTAIAKDPLLLDDFIARFKHALLFTPKLLLADDMVLSPNFKGAYRIDPTFKDLLCEPLIDIAHFERFKDGPAMTLVQRRKFNDYLLRGEDKRFDPREPSCPSDPFDSELEAIQSNVGRRFPDSVLRDPLFTEFADNAINADVLKAELGKAYGIYKAAYWRMRKHCPTPLGIIHFDEAHKVPRDKNIFDYMNEAEMFQDVPRERLVKEYGDTVARAHRTLLIKAEMYLLPGVHAILPSDLIRYRTLILTAANAGAISEREQLVHDIDVDLSAVTVRRLASLTANEICELRKAGEEYFAVMKLDTKKAESVDRLQKAVLQYTKELNTFLAFKSPPSFSERMVPGNTGKARIRVFQWNVERSTALGGDGIALMFKVVGDITHSIFPQVPRVLMDLALQPAATWAQWALAGLPIEASIGDIEARLARSEEELLMQYGR